MNLTSLHPKRRANLESKINSTVNITSVAKPSDIRNFSDVETSSVATHRRGRGWTAVL